MKVRNQPVTLVVVHHSASAHGTTLEQIDQWHRERGWEGCGYHYVIESGGKIRYGRPLHLVGAHCKGHNDNSVGICLVGDNTTTEGRWYPAQMDALVDLVAALRLVFGYLDVLTHNTLSTTACPGVEHLDYLNA